MTGSSPAIAVGEASQPLVSIITSAYNRAHYLAEVIESVLNQDYPATEYIVLDDGSTDGTWNIIAGFGDRIRAFRHPNMGETQTMNRGLELATGEIIGVVNSDDPLLPGAIRAAVEALAAHPELMVVYPDWAMIDEKGETVEEIRTFDYNYLDMLRWHHCVPGPGAFFRRSVPERLHGRDPQFRWVADFDFWLRAGLLGPFARIPRKLATFRFHRSSASVSAKGAAMAAEHIRLVKKIYALPDLPPEVRRIRREAFGSAHYIAGCVCGPDYPWTRKRHFLMALAYSPLKYLREYRERLSTVVLPDLLGFVLRPSSVPRRIYRAIRWLGSRAKRMLGRAGD